MGKGKGMRVLVLGAGMAGLGAARVLADAGAQVTVIEARDRIGGRTHTSHLWPDLPMDMGASWIHGTRGNPLVALARDLGLTMTATSYKRWIAFDEHGAGLPTGRVRKRALRLVDDARAAVDDLDADVSLKFAVETSRAWQKLSASDRRLYRQAINATIEHDYSGDWARLSAWHFDDGNEVAGGEAIVTPGFGAIAAHLARGLDIRLGQPVTAIAPRPRGVAVTTRDTTHEADCAVITLPLGVLQSGDLRLAEPLAPRRQRAIDRLGMGLLNKCVLRFDRTFWPTDVDWIGFLGPVENLWTDWTSYLGATGQPILVGFNAASMADEVEALDDRDTTASAMAAVRAMFGSNLPDPRASQISRWRRDPFARGAYSFVAVGSSRKDRRALQGTDWDGRLVFAGEATSRDDPGTVHGALKTGRSAAAQILKDWRAPG